MLRALVLRSTAPPVAKALRLPLLRVGDRQTHLGLTTSRARPLRGLLPVTCGARHGSSRLLTGRFG
jgi:hypothetical protein